MMSRVIHSLIWHLSQLRSGRQKMKDEKGRKEFLVRFEVKWGRLPKILISVFWPYSMCLCQSKESRHVKGGTWTFLLLIVITIEGRNGMPAWLFFPFFLSALFWFPVKCSPSLFLQIFLTSSCNLFFCVLQFGQGLFGFKIEGGNERVER